MALTDIATGWTECLPLLYRSGETVLMAFQRARTLFPFLLQQLWGYDYDGFDRTVDTHITRLRKKLGAPGEKMVTVWGVGYRFVS